MSPMTDKLAQLWPEIIMLTGATACLLIGLSKSAAARRSVVQIAGATLAIAALAVVVASPSTLGSDAASELEQLNVVDVAATTPLANYVKLAVAGIGLLLLMVAARLPERLLATRDAERGVHGTDVTHGATDPAKRAGDPHRDPGEAFDPSSSVRGEFFAFFLFSLTGLMLCAGADDLVWLFLALELTSLPTYVMVAISRDRLKAQEAAVKYFFLGAMAVAIFLYGFALIYGATGFTQFADIRAFAANELATTGTLPPLLILGAALAIVGIGFKIAAFPMHFYAADVYEGAATPVTAFLAFVPKAAGFVALILIVGLVTDATGSPPPVVVALLAVSAVLTMTIGNALGLLQNNLKRMLAYSSVAHSGYMLVGLLAGGAAVSAAATGNDALSNGHAAILFYLVAYGLANLGGFAVIACLERSGNEAATIDDVSGLARRSPILAAILLVSMLSLIGLPPMIGFVGKVYLFGAAVDEYAWLVVVAVLNSAVSAVYYLRVTAACYFGEPSDADLVDDQPRRAAASIAAVGAIFIGLTAGWLANAAHRAASPVGALNEPATVKETTASGAESATEENQTEEKNEVTKNERDQPHKPS